ncbi:hypothetical protein PVK06_047435 [Gossypium arboreum]|uniref:Uncharacterized protein n=1 Tax=Gossypium arboreum TaxID=29729 RepID=A0ABR0MFA0_GOSAR|nr:hypothetical protein PVK06_047435 [Gossypium arboreum]
MDMFRVWLPDDTTKDIVNIPPPQPLTGLDKISWVRVRLFFWFAFKKRLLTKVERVRRGLGYEECCTVCGNAPEDVIHAIRDYSVAKGVCSQLIPMEKQDKFYSENLQKWLESNLGNHYSFSLRDVDLQCFFGLMLDTGLVAAEWVLKDRHGGWILGFNKNLDHCSAFNAELWGVLDCLMILKSQKYDGALIRIDSQEAL